jgi:molybdopterin-guanine dinucleotide biosynthesis protein A
MGRIVENPVTLAILAGGNSKRMGADKDFQQLNGIGLLQTVLDRLSTLDLPVMIVTNDRFRGRMTGLVGRYKTITDSVPGTGVLGAIYTALLECKTATVFVTGCDMPFLDVRLIEHLVNISAGYNAVTPVLKGMTEPLHSIYSQACIPAIEYLLTNNLLKTSLLFPMVHTRYVAEEEIGRYGSGANSFININTPQDLARAIRIKSTGPQICAMEEQPHAEAAGATAGTR